MQPFPYRNAEQRRDEAREEKSTHARRERGPQDLKGGKGRMGQRHTDGEELVNIMSTTPCIAFQQRYDSSDYSIGA